MTVRLFVVGSLIAAVFGGGSLALTIAQLNPEKAGTIGFVLFFLSLFVATTSIMGLLGYGVRRLVLPRVFPTYLVRTSVRQGIMLGAFFSILLFLQLLRLYQWWIGLIIIAVFISFELIFLSYDRANRRQPAEDRE